jgi:hypothetical protein
MSECRWGSRSVLGVVCGQFTQVVMVWIVRRRSIIARSRAIIARSGAIVGVQRWRYKRRRLDWAMHIR